MVKNASGTIPLLAAVAQQHVSTQDHGLAMRARAVAGGRAHAGAVATPVCKRIREGIVGSTRVVAVSDKLRVPMRVQHAHLLWQDCPLVPVSANQV
jgi:hypothetical protein